MALVLVTGFQPFGGERTNPSWEAVRLLPEEVSGTRIARLEVPVVFGESGDLVVSAMRELGPDVVVCVGQAAGRTCVTVERTAVNVASAHDPDNAGNVPHDAPIVVGGPAAYPTTLPLRACVEAAAAAGVPARVSDTAGTYVCNQLIYRVLHEQAASGRGSAGFVHVPLSLAQAVDKPDLPSMSVEAMASALRAIVAACLA